MNTDERTWSLPYRHDTVRKHVRLRPEARDRIQAWADRHQTSFSAAIEGLALAGMEDATLETIASFLVLTVNKAFARQFNRFAKLIVFAGLEAGAAKEAAQHSYLLQLLTRQEGLPPPQKLGESLQIEADSPAGKELLRLYQQREQRFRWRAVKGMKKPIAELQDLLAEQADEETTQA